MAQCWHMVLTLFLIIQEFGIIIVTGVVAPTFFPPRTNEPDTGGTGTWGKWSKWGRCTKTCGGGIQAKSRKCKGIGFCPGGINAGVLSRACNEQACCLREPFVEEWGKWNDCPVTCGLGIQIRTRVCNNKECREKFCDENLIEDKDCDAGCCPKDPKWGKWSKWGPCSVTCGIGVQEKTRKCKVDNCEKSPKACIGPDRETRKCEDACCEGSAEWSDWTDWSDCSVSCGKGKTSRERECVVNEGTCKGQGSGPLDCKGKSKDKKNCDAGCCEATSWDEWSDWSECSASCGGGTMSRSRTCNRPCNDSPPCEGDNTENMSCNEISCGKPLCKGNKGKWSDWGPWETCSVSCGDGTRTRERECLPKNNKNCEPNPKKKVKCKGKGKNTEEEECNPGCCPGPSMWSDWTEWSKCCEKTKTRTRSCEPDIDCPGEIDCVGENTETLKCKKNKGSNASSPYGETVPYERPILACPLSDCGKIWKQRT